MLRRDFSLGLNIYFEAFLASGNPFYLWLAVEICIMLDKEFPNWLRRYLLQCAERMQSGKAKKGDLRKVLPWVFDFSKKSGPGNLLDPNKNAADAAARRGFALRFATKIVQQGEEPSKALTSACDEVLDQERAGKDVKTLRSWIVKDFGLKRWPRTAAEWESVKSSARARFGPYWSSLESRQIQKRSPARDGKRSRGIAS